MTSAANPHYQKRFDEIAANSGLQKRLVAEWGRIGLPGTVQAPGVFIGGLAEAALAKHLKIKTRRGYHRMAPRLTRA